MPDAVVVSRDLPQLNGDAVLDHIKRHPETRHLPVYVLAGLRRRGRRAASLRYAGALGCLGEPATAKLLGEVLDELSTSSSSAPARCWWWRPTSAGATGSQTHRRPRRRGRGRRLAEDALTQLDAREFDCIVLAVELEDGSAFSCSTASSARSASAACR